MSKTLVHFNTEDADVAVFRKPPKKARKPKQKLESLQQPEVKRTFKEERMKEPVKVNDDLIGQVIHRILEGTHCRPGEAFFARLPETVRAETIDLAPTWKYLREMDDLLADLIVAPTTRSIFLSSLSAINESVGSDAQLTWQDKEGLRRQCEQYYEAALEAFVLFKKNGIWDGGIADSPARFSSRPRAK